MPACQPRGKNDESVPKRRREGPRTERALLEGPFERLPAVEADPAVRAGRVEVDRRALVGGHERFAEESGAEVRHDHRNLREAERGAGQRERIAEPKVEAARQPELACARRPTARRSARRSRPRARPPRGTRGPRTRRPGGSRASRGRGRSPASGSSFSDRSSIASESRPVGLCMKKPTKRCGWCATASATDTASPGMLAISAARETPWRSSSAIQRSPSSVGVPGGSQWSLAAISSPLPASGASSSRKRDEKK